MITEALTIYNNAVSANRWENEDPKDTKIMALITQVQQLVEAQKNFTAKQTGEVNKSGNYLSIKAWRMTKISDSIEKDGKTWHWYPHYKVDGTNDGLYVTHRPEEHEDWKKNKFQFRRENF